MADKKKYKTSHPPGWRQRERTREFVMELMKKVGHMFDPLDGENTGIPPDFPPKFFKVLRARLSNMDVEAVQMYLDQLSLFYKYVSHLFAETMLEYTKGEEQVMKVIREEFVEADDKTGEEISGSEGMRIKDFDVVVTKKKK